LDGILGIEAMAEDEEGGSDRTGVTVFEPRLQFVDVLGVVHSVDPFRLTYGQVYQHIYRDLRKREKVREILRISVSGLNELDNAPDF
jgi:hypothetical protein